ncbi:MAG: Ig-like domain-containing protein [Taibaiella sp.]|nr:Ig-like domain-containing protein [Taibaiella sp.]
MERNPRLLALLLLAVVLFTAGAAHSQISGHLVVCRGASRTTLAGTPSGGTWASGDATRATVNSTTGEVTGVAAGTATISYTDPSSTVYTAVVTVNGYVMGNIGFSMGSDIRCTGGVPATCTVSPLIGNNWTSSDPSIATINTGGSVVPSATNAGTVTISYRNSYGNCYVTRGMTVNPTPTVSLTNPVCAGVTQTATGTPSGGTWMSSNASVGTINTTTGVLSAFIGGGTYIRYTVGSCLIQPFLTVSAGVAAFGGSTTICVGNTSTLTCATGGGTWSSSDPSVATIGSSTGVVTGVSLGTSTISYVVGSSCFRTAVVTVNVGPSASAGPDEVCVGQTIAVTNATGGGTWSSSSTARATVTTYGGTVTGIGAGTVNISYRVGGGCATVKTITVNAAMASIAGGPNVCEGSSVTLTHAMGAGTWTASNSHATVDLTTGVMTGVTAGSVNITYTASPGCKKAQMMIVKSSPAAITGELTVCPGTTTALSSASGGGTWSSSNTSVATVNSYGVVSAVSGGTATITYTVASWGCSATATVTVGGPTAGTITGSPEVCLDGTTVLTSTVSGGMWTSSDTSIATVAAGTGVVYGVAIGNAVITYTLSTSCGTVFAVKDMQVVVMPVAGTITGPSSVVIDSSVTYSLATATPGGVWSTSNPAIASVDSLGTVTGHILGTAVLSYIVSNICGSDTVTKNIRVRILCEPLIATIAGNGTEGYAGDGGSATDAAFVAPGGVAYDTSGNIYVADFYGGVIRKIRTDGTITTFAGTGSYGFSGDGGPAIAAAFAGPTKITFDASGNLFVADHYNNRIRKISPNGIISTVAGTGYLGFSGDGVPATATNISRPAVVKFGPGGDMYILDYNGCRIRKVNSAGIISTYAGTGTPGTTGDGGPATAAQIFYPFGMDFDTAGNLYFAEASGNTVRMIDNAGIIHTIAGSGTAGFSGDGGPASAAQLNNPAGILVHSDGSIYVADQFNCRIRRISGGTISSYAGTSCGYSGDGDAAIDAAVYWPNELIEGPDGSIVMTDNFNHVVRRISPNPASLYIYGLKSIPVDSATTYTASIPGGTWSSGNPTIATITSGGVLTGHSAGTVTIVYSVTNTCGTRSVTKQVRVRTGCEPTITTIVGNGEDGYSGDGGPASSAALRGPVGLAYDASGNLYVADHYSNVIRKISTSGIVSTFAGTGGYGYSGDGGPATAAMFKGPYKLTFDASGNLFVADHYSNRVRKITPAGIITTVAGTGYLGFSGDGVPATATNISRPSVVKFSPGGEMYIMDYNGCRIRKVDADGIISTVAGTGVPGTTGDGGPATAARIFYPFGMDFDATGNLYLVEAEGNRVRMIDTFGIIHTIAGSGTSGFSGDGGPASAATLSNPAGILVHSSGSIFFADQFNCRIRRIENDTISTYAGSSYGYYGDGGSSLDAEISLVNELVEAPNGDIIITDNNNHVIRRIAPCSVSAKGQSTNAIAAATSKYFELVVYPNPSVGLVNIESSVSGTVSLFAMDGRELEQTAIVTGINKFRIPAGIAGGVYLLRFTSCDGNTQTTRLIYQP